MKLERRVALALLLTVALCPGQKLRLVTDVSVAEAEYRDANEAWLRSDPNLERDLFKANPAEMRRRIHRAADLRDAVMLKKEAYLGLLVERVRALRGRLSAPGNGRIATDSLRKDLDSQQQQMLDQQVRLEGFIHDLPPGDEYLLVRRAMEEERLSLIRLQNSLALRMRGMDTIDKAQESIEAASGPIEKQLAEVLGLWEQELASVSRQRARWSELYRTMEQSLAPGKRESQPANRSSRARPEPVAPRPTAGSALTSSFAGNWVYQSQAGAWTGQGEPEMAALELKEAGDALSGTYVARLPVGQGLHTVRLTLVGTRSSTRYALLRWKSADPEAEGEAELKLSPDGRLLFERTRSNDNYIPRGMEVLVAR
jgi:hypothetical protein